jgi:hypothetical protein
MSPYLQVEGARSRRVPGALTLFSAQMCDNPAILGLISLVCFGVINWQKNGGRKN